MTGLEPYETEGRDRANHPRKPYLSLEASSIVAACQTWLVHHGRHSGSEMVGCSLKVVFGVEGRVPKDGMAGLIVYSIVLYSSSFSSLLFVCLLGFKGASTTEVILRPSCDTLRFSL